MALEVRAEAHRERPRPRPSEDAPGARIVATATALPRHRYDQAELTAIARTHFAKLDVSEALVARFFDRVGVKHRHLALPAERYADLAGLGERSRVWLEVATELGEQALSRALDEGGVAPSELGELVSTTVTGIAVPSLDARLMNRIALPPDLRRVPLFGIGCAGGAAGVARLDDYLRAYPDRAAALLSVELCSLTVQPEDFSVANLVSSGLFGDGAAAVVAVGPAHPLAAEAAPTVVDSRSFFFPDTERVMGWDVVDEGFQIVLGTEVPVIAREQVPPIVRAFLAEHGLAPEDIATWVTHPGGPKVMDSLEEGLSLPRGTLDPSRSVLARLGNLSSASILFLLDELRRQRRPVAGSHGLMLAMGPAFAAELVLLRW